MVPSLEQKGNYLRSDIKTCIFLITAMCIHVYLKPCFGSLLFERGIKMYKLRVKGNLFKNLNDFPTEPSSVWGIGNMLRSK